MEDEAKKPFHIGQRLRKYITDKRILQANWARAQGITPRTIAFYFKKESMQVATLFTICQVLKYNFLREIADQLPPDLPPHPDNPLQPEMDALKKENERLKLEIEILNRIAGGKNQ